MLYLATTVHDDNERLLHRAEPHIEALRALFGGAAAVCTSNTSLATMTALRIAGYDVHLVQPGCVGAARTLAVTRARAHHDDARILYIDYDRLLHWFDRYPDELAAIIRADFDRDFVALGRTDRAMSTHPRVQIVTEAVTNAAWSALTRQPGQADFLTAACILSPRAAAVIERRSVEQSHATDLEWPALVLREYSVVPLFVQTEGLEFETADYYSDAIERAGSLDEWMRSEYDSPESWTKRIRFSGQATAALIRVLAGQ